MKISLVVFALNEIDGMRVVMPQIKKEWVDEIVVVDGHSTDGTIEYCREHGYHVHVQKKPGMGACFVEAMEVAEGDVIIMFTPDGNSLPDKIPQLVEKMKEGYDLVIASRYLPPAKSEDDDLVTAFGNRMFTGLINFLFHGHATDSLVGFFAFRKRLFDELKIGETETWGPRLLMRCMKKGKRIEEIAANEPKRIGGARKMQPLRNGYWVLRMILKEFVVGNRY